MATRLSPRLHPARAALALLQMLGMLEGSGYEKTGAGSAASIHYVAEVMRRFYADRSEYFGDPDFLQGSSAQAAGPRLHRAAAARASTPSTPRPASRFVQASSPRTKAPRPRTSTSWTAKATRSLSPTRSNGGYGSGVTVPGLGFLLNDEMDDFTAKPGTENMFHLIQGEANAIQPGKRPVSSMRPPSSLRDGKLFLVLGAPGGARIPNGILQVILNVDDFHMNVQDAVDWPRFHHQWMPDVLYVEKGISPDTVALLPPWAHVAPLESTSPVWRAWMRS